MIKKASFLALVSCAVFSASCYAGQYAQALGDCVYDNLSREDKNVMTQWAFVTLGKTDAAKQITVIPESKIKQVNKEAKKRLRPALEKLPMSHSMNLKTAFRTQRHSLESDLPKNNLRAKQMKPWLIS